MPIPRVPYDKKLPDFTKHFDEIERRAELMKGKKKAKK